MSLRHLWIRTEASSDIGLGHFMRCFAIAEEARHRGIAVTFALSVIESAVQARIDSIGATGLSTGGLPGTTADILAMSAARLTRDDWLIIDTYTADHGYIALQSALARVAVIDDLNLLPRFDCDLLINPAHTAHQMGYDRKTRARKLFGLDYALVRSEFQTRAETGDAVTVTFGGSDPNNLTAEALKTLRKALPDRPLRVIAGPANVHTCELTLLSQMLGHIELIVAPTRVADALSGSALIVTAAGGSVNEIAAMALPALVLVVYDNQAAALTGCPFPVLDARVGMTADLGDTVCGLMADPARLRAIADIAHAQVDGRGPARILDILQG